MLYRLVQRIEGQWIKSEFAAENAIAAMGVRGFRLTGVHNSRSTRAELNGCPKFAGVLGPMWDGDAIRYECPEANRILSE